MASRPVTQSGGPLPRERGTTLQYALAPLITFHSSLFTHKAACRFFSAVFSVYSPWFMENRVRLHPIPENTVKQLIIKTLKQLTLAVAAVILAQTAFSQASPGEIHGRVFEKKGTVYEGTVIVWTMVQGSQRKTGIDD